MVVLAEKQTIQSPFDPQRLAFGQHNLLCGEGVFSMADRGELGGRSVLSTGGTMDWKTDLDATIKRETDANLADGEACTTAVFKEQIADRVDALIWARRCMPGEETRRHYAFLLERERDANFRRHARTKRSCYSTTAYALQWVLDKMGVTA